VQNTWSLPLPFFCAGCRGRFRIHAGNYATFRARMLADNLSAWSLFVGSLVSDDWSSVADLFICWAADLLLRPGLRTAMRGSTRAKSVSLAELLQSPYRHVTCTTHSRHAQPDRRTELAIMRTVPF